MLYRNFEIFARSIVSMFATVRLRALSIMYILNPCPTVEVMTNYNKVGFSLMSVCLYRTINMFFCSSSSSAFNSFAIESYTPKLKLNANIRS